MTKYCAYSSHWVLRLKKVFSSADIIEEYFPLYYRTDFNFKKHMLVVETDEKGHNEKDLQVMKRKDKKIYKRLVTTLLELILINQVSMIMKNFGE